MGVLVAVTGKGKGIDTNVLVSALLRWDSVPGAVLEQALVGSIVPLLSDEIIDEYETVLRRPKFHFKETDILSVIEGLSILTARVDKNDKLDFDVFCSSVGLTSSAAINMFSKAVLREKRCPIFSFFFL